MPAPNPAAAGLQACDTAASIDPAARNSPAEPTCRDPLTLPAAPQPATTGLHVSGSSRDAASSAPRAVGPAQLRRRHCRHRLRMACSRAAGAAAGRLPQQGQPHTAACGLPAGAQQLRHRRGCRLLQSEGGGRGFEHEPLPPPPTSLHAPLQAHPLLLTPPTPATTLTADPGRVLHGQHRRDQARLPAAGQGVPPGCVGR